MDTNLTKIANEFLKTLQNRNSSEEIIQYYHKDIEQIEFPNTLTKEKTLRNLEDLKQPSERGKNVLLSEEYKVLKSFSFNNTGQTQMEITY